MVVNLKVREKCGHVQQLAEQAALVRAGAAAAGSAGGY
jgi:hypothetical protein